MLLNYWRMHYIALIGMISVGKNAINMTPRVQRASMIINKEIDGATKSTNKKRIQPY